MVYRTAPFSTTLNEPYHNFKVMPLLNAEYLEETLRDADIGTYTRPTAYGFAAHSYADDTQVYISTPASNHSDAMRRLSDCITLIRDWMDDNRLKLNEDKTQVIWLGTRQQLNKITEQSLILPNATVESTSKVNDLGVLLDNQLTVADHITALSRSCFFSSLSAQIN